MTEDRSPDSPARDALEQRRLAAARLLAEGVPQNEVARRVGVACSTVCEWNRRLKRDGEAGLQASSRGRPPRLTPSMQQSLSEILRLAGDAGHDSGRMTIARMSLLVEALFDVRYSDAQICRLRAALTPASMAAARD